MLIKEEDWNKKAQKSINAQALGRKVGAGAKLAAIGGAGYLGYRALKKNILEKDELERLRRQQAEGAANYYSDVSNIAEFGIVNRLKGLGKKAKGVAVRTSQKLDDSIVAVGAKARDKQVARAMNKGNYTKAAEIASDGSRKATRNAGLTRVGGVTAAVAGTGAAGVVGAKEYNKRKKTKSQ